MTKITAILNFVAGLAFTLIGVFALARVTGFLSAAPRDHDALVAWAFMIAGVGLCLIVGGLIHMRRGASQLHGPEMPEDLE
jgi:hypothetical protein